MWDDISTVVPLASLRQPQHHRSLSTSQHSRYWFARLAANLWGAFRSETWNDGVGN